VGKRGSPVHGWVLLDKPYGMSSTQAVGKIRWLFGAQKAGHGGTLDPLATGMLPIALGEATKTVPFAMEGRKVYRFEVTWGEERTTDDLEGSLTIESNLLPDSESIDSILHEFTGEISQLPPAFSAIKVDGERAYDLARAGEAVELEPRMVHIEDLRVIEHPAANRTVFEVTCGKGTYVRSLARDMGRRLGCFGFVSMLRRLAVAPFREDHMISLETLEEMSHKPAGLTAESGALRGLETVLDGIPALALNELEARRLSQGQFVSLAGKNAPATSEAVLVTSGEKPLGIGHIEAGLLKPRRLFNL
jgi:tRNA pseudouridine55 synthase